MCARLLCAHGFLFLFIMVGVYLSIWVLRSESVFRLGGGDKGLLCRQPAAEPLVPDICSDVFLVSLHIDLTCVLFLVI